VAALFPPRDANSNGDLTLLHNPSLSNSHVIVRHEKEVEIKEGVWLLGAYVHTYSGPELRWQHTGEAEAPQQLPLDVTIMHGLADFSAVSYAPDASFFVTGSTDGMLRVWGRDGLAPNAAVRADGTPEAPLAVRAVAVNPRGDTIATIGDSGAVRVWSLAGLRLLADVPGHLGAGFWIAFTPDGTRVVSAAHDGEVHVWRLETNELERRFPWPEELGPHPRFVFGTDRRVVYVAGSQGTAGMVGELDLYRGKPTLLHHPPGLGRVTALSRSPSGAWLAVGDVGGDIRAWHQPGTGSLAASPG